MEEVRYCHQSYDTCLGKGICSYRTNNGVNCVLGDTKPPWQNSGSCEWQKNKPKRNEDVTISREAWNQLVITLSTILFRLKPNWCQDAGDPLHTVLQIERATRKEE